ncbi:BTAD domain-containing putative transcriptional regulator [Actinoplanes sp. CA-054009]
MGQVVRIRVFGGLRLWRSGTEVDLGSVRAQTVLAVLLAARGATVSTAELVDTLWGERPSASALNQLHRLIGQVRRLFEPDLPSRETGAWLSPVGEGYRLRQDARTSDLMAFFELAADGQWERALTIGREQPFAGLPPFPAIEAARVEVAVEAADRVLTDHRERRLIPLLMSYGQAAPYHEPLQARLIRLLAAAGRRAEALTLFEAVRQRLSEDLGADPGEELRAAHLEALTDPERPSQLPLRVAAFSPRDNLTAGLEAGRKAGLIVLTGMGGAGKTALAVDWAHRVAGEFPDGQLYLDLRGFAPGGRRLRPAEALTTVLMTLGVRAIGDDPDALSAQLRSALADRRMIILLDNARDSAQVRPLLPGSPGCLLVVTSRNRMPGLVAREGAWPVHVGRLGSPAARNLLARRLGSARLAAEPAVTDRLVQLCAGLPLALSIAAARIAVSPGESLSDVVADLDGLDALDTGEEHDSVRAAFSWSYTVLSEPSARLFRLLAVHPAAEVTAAAAASIAGADVRAALTELTVTSMLTPLGAGRYTVHDLLHAYAAELLDGGEDGRLDAERRLVEHYVHASRRAYLTFKLLLPVDPGPVPPGVFPPPIDDVAAATEWYARERATVLAVTGLALDRGWARSAALILVHVRPMRAIEVEVTADIQRQGARAVDAVAALDDPELEALILREAAVQRRGRDREAARGYLLRALAIAERRDDLLGQAQALRNLAIVPAESGPREVDYARRAVAAARQAGEPSVLLYALNAGLAFVLKNTGDVAGMAEVLDEAFALAGRAGMTSFQVAVATSRAWAAGELGDDGTAVRMAEWALEHAEPTDHRTVYSATVALARSYHRLGDLDRAVAAAEAFQESLARNEVAFREFVGDREVDADIAQVDAVLGAAGSARGSH